MLNHLNSYLILNELFSMIDLNTYTNNIKFIILDLILDTHCVNKIIDKTLKDINIKM